MRCDRHAEHPGFPGGGQEALALYGIDEHPDDFLCNHLNLAPGLFCICYYWKQWKQPRTRRRQLIALGANPAEVKMATRSRKGYWRMSSNRIVQQALSNRWLEEQGVPDMRTLWIRLHYGPQARV